MAKKKGIVIDYNRIEKQVFALAEPLAAICGAELIDVEYVKEAGNWYLRLYLDRAEAPVDLDLCEKVSNLVSDALDKEDPVDMNYFLEVSSPGLERPLKREQDFKRFAGREVTVKLYAPKDGKKEFFGTLGGLNEEGGIVLETEGGSLTFAAEEVARAHLVADLDD